MELNMICFNNDYVQAYVVTRYSLIILPLVFHCAIISFISILIIAFHFLTDGQSRKVWVIWQPNAEPTNEIRYINFRLKLNFPIVYQAWH